MSLLDPGTYGDARLRLGILNVGFVVVASVVALALGLPEVVLRFEPTPTGDALGLATVAGLYVVANSPFDYYGGYVLPNRYEEDPPDLRGFVGDWARGALVQAGLFVPFGIALMYTGRATDPFFALVALLGINVFLLVARRTVAAAVGGFGAVYHHDAEADGDGISAEERTELEAALAVFDEVDLPRPDVSVYTNSERSFTGGFAGRRVIVPRSWFDELAPDELAVALARRSAAMKTGSERRGVAFAVVWNTLAFLGAATYAPDPGFGDVASFVNLLLGYTLFSFLGLVVLPRVTRSGTYEVDRATIDAGIAPETFERTVRKLDEAQNESGASGLVGNVFYPIPSVEDRLDRLRNGVEPGSVGAWNCSRTRLYQSWACLDFLSRAVHCNVGKPELWVYPPSD